MLNMYRSGCFISVPIYRVCLYCMPLGRPNYMVNVHFGFHYLSQVEYSDNMQRKSHYICARGDSSACYRNRKPMHANTATPYLPKMKQFLPVGRHELDVKTNAPNSEISQRSSARVITVFLYERDEIIMSLHKQFCAGFDHAVCQ